MRYIALALVAVLALVLTVAIIGLAIIDDLHQIIDILQ